MTPGQVSSSEVISVGVALSWLAEMFEESPANVQENTRREDIPAWDSLGQLVLMAALDQRFGIRLSQTELPSLGSVQDILDVLRRHGRLLDG